MKYRLYVNWPVLLSTSLNSNSTTSIRQGTLYTFWRGTSFEYSASEQVRALLTLLIELECSYCIQSSASPPYLALCSALTALEVP